MEDEEAGESLQGVTGSLDETPLWYRLEGRAVFGPTCHTSCKQHLHPALDGAKLIYLNVRNLKIIIVL